MRKTLTSWAVGAMATVALLAAQAAEWREYELLRLFTPGTTNVPGSATRYTDLSTNGQYNWKTAFFVVDTDFGRYFYTNAIELPQDGKLQLSLVYHATNPPGRNYYLYFYGSMDGTRWQTKAAANAEGNRVYGPYLSSTLTAPPAVGSDVRRIVTAEVTMPASAGGARWRFIRPRAIGWDQDLGATNYIQFESFKIGLWKD